MLELFSYIATLSVLVSYFIMNNEKKVKQFNVVNFFASIPLVALSLSAHVYPNAILSGFFGIIGLYGWWKESRD